MTTDDNQEALVLVTLALELAVALCIVAGIVVLASAVLGRVL